MTSKTKKKLKLKKKPREWYSSQLKNRRCDMITPQELRDEGVLEIGTATRSSVVYVRTKCGLHLFHADLVPLARVLDDWGINSAIDRLERGFTLGAVSGMFGIKEEDLRRQLVTVGFELPSTRVVGPRRGAKARFDNRALRPKWGTA